MRTTTACAWLLTASLAGSLVGRAQGEAEITAISAIVLNGYERSRLPDGTFKPEHYAFGEGGFTGTATKDSSVDELSFRQIARAIAPGLMRQNYLSSQDPEKTDLLIMVYWGETGADSRAAGGYKLGPAAIPPPPPPPKIIVVGSRKVYIPNQEPRRGPQADIEQPTFDAMASMQNRERDRENLKTAQLLGYDEALARAASRPEGRTYLDLVDELEDSRYFVVLRAYDFRLMWKEKKPKPLWEARYSIRARGHLFNESLGPMTDTASRYFGRATKGLVRHDVPLGGVRLAEPEFSEYRVPDGKK